MARRNGWKWNMCLTLLSATLGCGGLAEAGEWVSQDITVATDSKTTYYGGLVSGQNLTGWTAGSDCSLSDSQAYNNATIQLTKEGGFTLARLMGAAINGNNVVLSGTDATNPMVFSGNTITSARANGDPNSLGIGGGLVYGGSSLNVSDATFSGNTTTAAGTYIMGGVIGSYINNASGLNNVNVTDNTTSGLAVAGAVAAMSGADSFESGRYFYITGNSEFSNNTSTGTVVNTVMSDKQTRIAAEGGAAHIESHLYLGGKTEGGATLTFSGNKAIADTNTANAAGGALYANRSTLVTTNNNTLSFTGNTAQATGNAYGGAMYAGRCCVDGATSYEINFGGSGNKVTFTGNKADGTNSYGGAIAAMKLTNSDSTVTMPVDVTLGAGNTYNFSNNSAIGTSSGYGGAIFSGNDVNIQGSATFKGNTTSTEGGAIYAMRNINFSGQNVNVLFEDNKVNLTKSAYGHDISAAGNVNVTGTGTYTFRDGVSADGSQFYQKSGEGDLVLTTGNALRTNVSSGGNCFGVIYASNNVTLDGVKFQNSTLDTNGMGFDSSKQVCGIVFGNYGVHMNNATSSGNTVISDIAACGTIYANTGSATLWSNEKERYSTISGETTFSGNTVESSKEATGAAITSAPYLFLGAKKGTDGALDAGGSNITFENNTVKATGAGEADGGAIFTYRNVITKSDNNTLVFNNNKAISDSGKAIGGAITAQSYYDYGNDTGEFGIDFRGKNNNVTFSNNSATSATGTGNGGALALIRSESANNPMIQLGGDGSTYLFENNTASTRGGAIHADGNVRFSGTGTTATFVGNTAGGIANDIEATGSVSFQDAGTYSFGGGITSDGLSITDASVTFGAGSKSNVGALTLDNANLTIQLSDTSFVASSLDATNANSLVLYSTLTEVGTETAITKTVGSTDSLKLDYISSTVLLPRTASNLLGVLSVDETSGNLVITTKEIEAGKTYTTSGDEIGNLDTAIQDGDSVVVTGNNTMKTTLAETVKTVSIQSNSANVQTIGNTTAGTASITTSGTSSDTTAFNLNNVKFSGNAIQSSGNVTITGDNVSFIHSGDSDVVITAANTTFSNGTFTVGSTIDGSNELKNATLIVGGSSEQDIYEVTDDFTAESSTIVLSTYGAGTEDSDYLKITGTATLNEGTVFQFDTMGTAEQKQYKYRILTSGTALEDAVLNNLSGSGAWSDWVFSLSDDKKTLYATATSPIPEPASWMMMVLGFMGLRFFRRKK